MRTKSRLPLFAAIIAAGAVSMAGGCVPRANPTPPPATASAAEIKLANAAVLIGAGDIAGCDQNNDMLTAILVDSILKADSVAGVETAVFTIGDNVYPSGSKQQFEECFGATWGSPERRIMAKIHPATGNHEYYQPGAGPYFDYFGDKAGPRGKGYYSYNVGEWHVITINSAIPIMSSFSAAAKKEQEDWLKKDLDDNKSKKCTIAIWHEPRFSSGWHGNEPRMGPIWQILYDNGVDLVLNGHDHNYERMAPVNPAGQVDSTKGMIQIVAGMGGGSLRGLASSVIPNSLVRIEGHPGVLMLTLGSAEYRSAYLDTKGRVWDPSGGKCH
jgi:3',5'-cyclic AMP phosphodiesterase CpdA